jgi:hypothetical protein
MFGPAFPTDDETVPKVSEHGSCGLAWRSHPRRNSQPVSAGSSGPLGVRRRRPFDSYVLKPFNEYP